jgi:hypothetical protein
MLSLISVPASFIYGHVYVLLGYAICVLFPIPWLSRLILDGWKATGAKLYSMVMSKFSSTKTTSTINNTTTL